MATGTGPGSGLRLPGGHAAFFAVAEAAAGRHPPAMGAQDTRPPGLRGHALFRLSRCAGNSNPSRSRRNRAVGGFDEPHDVVTLQR